MSAKTRYRRAQPEDLDEKDTVLAGVEFNVVYLGSTTVPTHNGHGSSNTAVAVDKMYTEKYKPFAFSSKIKVSVQISSDKVSILEVIEGERKEVAYFSIDTITFCNTDRKHDRAFAFVVKEDPYPTFRAYIFHSESPLKAREMAKLCNEAVKVKENLLEVTRVRTLSAPDGRARHDVTAATSVSKNPAKVHDNARARLTNAKQSECSTDSGRVRSWTEMSSSDRRAPAYQRPPPVAVNNTGMEPAQSLHTSGQLIDLAIDEDEDGFTQLAQKRTQSFKGENPEKVSLVSNVSTEQKLHTTPPESVNLLHL